MFLSISQSIKELASACDSKIAATRDALKAFVGFLARNSFFFDTFTLYDQFI